MFIGRVFVKVVVYQRRHGDISNSQKAWIAGWLKKTLLTGIKHFF